MLPPIVAGIVERIQHERRQGGDPNKPLTQYEQEIKPRGSGRYEGEIPTTGRLPVTTATSDPDPTVDQVEDLESDWQAEAVEYDASAGGNADAADGVTADYIWTGSRWMDKDGEPVYPDSLNP